MKLPALVMVCLLLGGPTRLFAQMSEEKPPAEMIQELMVRIDQLERRIAQLEKGEARVTPVPGLGGTTIAARDHEQMGTAMQTEAQATYPGLKLAGFGDFTFSGLDQRGTRSGFNAGQFTLHLNSMLSPKVSFLGEITLSARADAGTGTPAATGFNAEVERSIVRFDQNDRFKVSFGRYHTPINYWNTAFHHGQWLQTTVARPEMTQFGGRFIPVHFVGALVEGAAPARGLNLNYNFGVGNGRGSVISRGGEAGDNNNHRAWLVNIFARPDQLYGLQVGGSVYRDKVTLAAGRDYPEWISSAHVVWQKETPEVVAEFANINHHDAQAPTSNWNSQAFYVQLAYRLPAFEKLWKPYYRFEYIHIPRSDAVLQGVPNLAGSVLGLRYDISSFAALKFEYRNQRRAPGQPRINGGFIQTSFTF